MIAIIKGILAPALRYSFARVSRRRQPPSHLTVPTPPVTLLKDSPETDFPEGEYEKEVTQDSDFQEQETPVFTRCKLDEAAFRKQAIDDFFAQLAKK